MAEYGLACTCVDVYDIVDMYVCRHPGGVEHQCTTLGLYYQTKYGLTLTLRDSHNSAPDTRNFLCRVAGG